MNVLLGELWAGWPVLRAVLLLAAGYLALCDSLGLAALTEETETWPSGNVYIARKVYDESGLLAREEWVSPETGTSGMDYTYDGAGRLAKSAADDNGVVGNVYEYDCDDAGRITARRF